MRELEGRGVPTPRGVTAPRPVITTLRIFDEGEPVLVRKFEEKVWWFWTEASADSRIAVWWGLEGRYPKVWRHNPATRSRIQESKVSIRTIESIHNIFSSSPFLEISVHLVPSPLQLLQDACISTVIIPCVFTLRVKLSASSQRQLPPHQT